MNFFWWSMRPIGIKTGSIFRSSKRLSMKLKSWTAPDEMAMLSLQGPESRKILQEYRIRRRTSGTQAQLCQHRLHFQAPGCCWPAPVTPGEPICFELFMDSGSPLPYGSGCWMKGLSRGAGCPGHAAAGSGPPPLRARTGHGPGRRGNPHPGLPRRKARRQFFAP
jgi:hypothetical protein